MPSQVLYDTSGFLEKNRDVLHADLLELLASCDSALPKYFAKTIGESVQKSVSSLTPRSVGSETKQSVATKFKVACNLRFASITSLQLTVQSKSQYCQIVNMR